MYSQPTRMKQLSERSLLFLLAAVQFTHIVDFMIMMPLGPQLMRELTIGPQYFSALVAAYTISSGAVGLLAAPFIDRFDRRKVLFQSEASLRSPTYKGTRSEDRSFSTTTPAASAAIETHTQTHTQHGFKLAPRAFYGEKNEVNQWSG